MPEQSATSSESEGTEQASDHVEHTSEPEAAQAPDAANERALPPASQGPPYLTVPEEGAQPLVLPDEIAESPHLGRALQNLGVLATSHPMQGGDSVEGMSRKWMGRPSIFSAHRALELRLVDVENKASYQHSFPSSHDFLNCLDDPNVVGERYDAPTHLGDCDAPATLAQRLDNPRYQSFTEVTSCEDLCCTFAEPPEAHRSLFVRKACFEETAQNQDALALASLDLQVSPALDADPAQVLRVRAWDLNRIVFDMGPTQASTEEMLQALGPAREIELISPGAYQVENQTPLIHRFSSPDELVACLQSPDTCGAPPEVVDFLSANTVEERFIYSGTAVRECDDQCCSFMPNQGNKFALFLKGVCFDREPGQEPHVVRMVMDSEPQ